VNLEVAAVGLVVVVTVVEMGTVDNFKNSWKKITFLIARII
jgi:hypothetical protein